MGLYLLMKILFLTDYAGIGGGETSLLNTMREGLTSGLFKPILYCCQMGELCDTARSSGIPVWSGNLSFCSRGWVNGIPVVNPLGIYRLVKLIRSEHVDAVHINSAEVSLSHGMIAAKLCGVPAFWTCHGQWEHPYGLRCKIITPFLKKVFFVSAFVESYSEFPIAQGMVTYLGFSRSKSKNSETFCLRKQLSISSASTVIGVVGRFQDIKRQDLLVSAAKRLLSQGHKELVFAFIGETQFSKKNDAYKQSVIEKVKQSGFESHFLFLGHQENMSVVYAMLDLVVIPSKYESFSMVTLESLAYGKTIVATDGGAPRELLGEGKWGYLFKSENVDSLVSAIQRAVKSPLKASEVAARAENFSIEKYCQHLVREYYA